MKIFLRREIYAVKRIFEMEDLDCAHCAARMEDAIRKIEGVTYVSISFMAQRMTLEADDAVFAEVLKQAAKAVEKIDGDCRVIVK